MTTGYPNWSTMSYQSLSRNLMSCPSLTSCWSRSRMRIGYPTSCCRRSCCRKSRNRGRRGSGAWAVSIAIVGAYKYIMPYKIVKELLNP